MNAKEKAIEITFKYQNLVTTWSCYWDTDILLEDRMEDMKQCALIAVDEILKVENNYFPNESNYWQEVQKEIELL